MHIIKETTWVLACLCKTMAPCLPVCVKPWLLLVKPWTCCHQLAPPVRSGNTLASYLLLDSLSCSYQPTSIFTIPPKTSNDCYHCIPTPQQTQQGSIRKTGKNQEKKGRQMRKERRELFWKLVKELSLQSFFCFFSVTISPTQPLTLWCCTTIQVNLLLNSFFHLVSVVM